MSGIFTDAGRAIIAIVNLMLPDQEVKSLGSIIAMLSQREVFSRAEIRRVLLMGMKLDRLIIGLVFALTGEVSQAMLAWDTSECSTDVLYCTKGTAAGTFVDEFELPELDFPNELELAAEIGSSSILIGGLENTRDQKIPAKYGVTISSLDWVDFPLGVRGFIGLTISSAAIANLTRSDISLATQSGTTGLGGQIRHVPIRAMIEREDRLVGARFVIVTLLGVFVCLLVGIGYARRRKRIKEFEKELEIERARPRAPVY